MGIFLYKQCDENTVISINNMKFLTISIIVYWHTIKGNPQDAANGWKWMQQGGNPRIGPLYTFKRKPQDPANTEQEGNPEIGPWHILKGKPQDASNAKQGGNHAIGTWPTFKGKPQDIANAEQGGIGPWPTLKENPPATSNLKGSEVQEDGDQFLPEAKGKDEYLRVEGQRRRSRVTTTDKYIGYWAKQGWHMDN